MKEFTTKHGKKIVGTLSGFDRVRFRGSMRMLCSVKGMMAWLFDQGLLLKDFKSRGLELTARMKAAVEQMAAAAARPLKYLASSALSKEDLVQELAARDGISEGIVCVISCVEPCRSFEIHKIRETKMIDLVPAYRKCLHWYVYFVDQIFGLCHVRIQSWLPFSVHICINGREWLCRQLTAAGIGFQRADNCLVQVADFAAAQEFLDRQPWHHWGRALDQLLQRACPAVSELSFRGQPLSYYWSADQTEWATDLLFRTPEDLAELYPALIRHGMTTFSSRDVLRFLGRYRGPLTQGIPGYFRGEIQTKLKSRPEGVRIKHHLNNNSIKMYNKQHLVLRVETTIHDPHDMKVFRTSEADPAGPKSWRVLRKAVADLPRRAEISQAANARYLAALGAVDAHTPLAQILDAVSAPVTWKGRRVRGLNPLTGQDAELASHLLRGEFTITGFRNQDLRKLLYPAAQSAAEGRRQSGRVTRLLRIFRAHGLLQKIQGTHRYQPTAHGRQALPSFLAARSASIQNLNKLAV